MAGIRLLAAAFILALILSSCAGTPSRDEHIAEPPQVAADEPENNETAAVAEEIGAGESDQSVKSPESEESAESVESPQPSTEVTEIPETSEIAESTDKDHSPGGSGIEGGSGPAEPSPVPDKGKKSRTDAPGEEAVDPVEQVRSTGIPDPVFVEEPDEGAEEPVTDEFSLFNPLLAEDVPYEEPLPPEEDDLVVSSPVAESVPAVPSSPVPSAGSELSADPVEPPVDITSAEPEPTTGDFTRSWDNGSDGESGESSSVSVELITPAEKAAAPSRWMDSPGEFSVVLEGQGWVFRSDLSTPGSWRFLGRELEGESTIFSFMFEDSGDWNLVFERQDLSSGGSERSVRNVRVGDDGGAVVENGPLSRENGGSIPGNMPDDPLARAEAAREAADAGRSGEALGYWGKDADRNDQVGRDARAAIVEEAARTGATAPLVTWLPRYIEDGADPRVLASALEVLENQMGYDDSATLVVEVLAGHPEDPRYPEWLYRLARQLEKPGESRDLDRAAALYRQVVEGWPLTTWRDLSEERLAWLQRHYFRVR